VAALVLDALSAAAGAASSAAGTLGLLASADARVIGAGEGCACARR
jgi:hypothetical protein